MHIAEGVDAAIAEMGWRNGLLYLASRALEVLTGRRCRIFRYDFVAQPVPAGPAAAPRSASTRIQVREVASQDPIVQSFPRPAAVISARFAHGARCFVALRQEVFVGYLWIQEGDYMEDEVRCRYQLAPPGAAVWDFDVYVTPEMRLSRAFALLWSAANAYLRSRGFKWSMSRISGFNPHSLASHRRMGIVRLASGTFLVAGRLQVSMLTCAPFLHIGMRDSQFPVVLFSPPEGANSLQATTVP